MDFKGLNEYALRYVTDILMDLSPGGMFRGNEYCCADIHGGKGDSFKFNTQTGKWADFATNQKGGDVTSYAAENMGIDQGAAYSWLANTVGYMNGATKPLKEPKPVSEPVEKRPLNITPPPADAPTPQFKGQHWEYKGSGGETLFFVERVDTPEGKEFYPLTWDAGSGKWTKRAFPKPRPLYGLELLAKDGGKPVLIVEGEKACDAARGLLSAYTVVSWSGGANAWDKTDWTPIYGRAKVCLWPDADPPGRQAMAKLSAALLKHVGEVKIISPPPDRFDGWDAADAVAEGWTKEQWYEWAKGRVTVVVAPQVVERMPDPEPPPDMNVNVNVEVEKQRDPIPATAYAIHQECGIVMTGKGGNQQPVLNEDNVLRILEAFEPLKDLCWYDEFHERIMTKWNTDSGEARSWSHGDDLNLLVMFQRQFWFRKLNLKTIRLAIEQYAHNRRRNEPQDWIRSLKWDGTPRIETFLINYCGAQDTEYVKAVTKNFWIALAARIFDPGCKFDYMLILEGKQNIAKSFLFDIIGGKFYCAPMEDVTKKDFIISARGKFLLELPELDAMASANNKTKKRVLSTRIDRLRGHFDKHHEDKGRSFVYVGTTNEKTYLDDDTGDRRYWPVKIKYVILDDVRTVRDQLFAEAHECYKRGDKWWEVPDTAKTEQSNRAAEDPWMNSIEKWLINREPFRINELLTSCLEIEVSKQDAKVEKRAAKILRLLGWSNEPIWENNKTVRKWQNLTPDVRMTHDVVKNDTEQGIPAGMRQVYNEFDGTVRYV